MLPSRSLSLRAARFLLPLGALAALTAGAASTGCSSDLGESTASTSSATTNQCSIDSIVNKCKIQTPYVSIKSTPPGSAPPPSAGGCDGFNCANYASNFCRCAEALCPGQVGKLVYQASVRCTSYYNCDHVSVRHAVDILCEPKEGDPTKKSCACIEPQGDPRPYEYAGSRRDFGINEDPPDDFCMTPVCTAYMGDRYHRTGSENWRPCPGNDVHESCGNTNGSGAERCPSTCCLKGDGTVDNHCLECDRSKLNRCADPDAGAPDATVVPVPVPIAVHDDAGTP